MGVLTTLLIYFIMYMPSTIELVTVKECIITFEGLLSMTRTKRIRRVYGPSYGPAPSVNINNSLNVY